MNNRDFNFLEGQTVSNVSVVPFIGIMDTPSGGSFHEGGPIWKDWDNAGRKRYMNNGNTEDDEPALNEKPVVTIEGKSAWLGPQFPHFGHQVADAATRYLATGQDTEVSTYILGDKQFNNQGKIRQTTAAILDWFDIDVSKVRVVSKSVKCQTLVAFPQAEQRNQVGPNSKYIEALTEHQNKKLLNVEGGEGEKYFVSRAGMPAHIAGESFLEDIFAAHGYKVIRPELLPLMQQLKIYAGAKELVFTEGSALHAMQLLGQVGANIYVINRRPNTKLGKHLFAPRTPSIEYIEADVSLLHGCRLSGDPAPETGLAVPTLSGLQQCLSKIMHSAVFLNASNFEAAVKTDFDLWLAHESKQRRFTHESYLNILSEKLDAAGLTYLKLRY
jgi:hypothetical protein